MNEAGYRFAMIITLAIGFWEGPMAIIFRVFTDKEPTLLTAANHLPSPWCYMAAVAATVAAFALIAVLDLRRKALLRDEPGSATTR
ncbi:hypothetical protein [Actinoplanes sichuanensis]|uniref:Uncharacterized protein n=1 Tax=Actinoplanes sichuanensis TaxID=512349 RepID=A0ABW4AJP3_9ACTN|nr:hypothetical protein [Actinoplanes sichuanensis]